MASTKVDIAPNILQVVLNIQGEEVGRLRRQLQAAEVRNEVLRREVAQVKGQRDAAEAAQTSIALELVEAREFIRSLQSPPPRRLSEIIPSYPDIVPFCADRSPRRHLKAVKNLFDSLSVIVLRDEFVWEQCPDMGYSIKPTRRRARKGQWMDCRNTKLLRPRNELVACFSGRWCYLGTYTSVTSETVTTQAFGSLQYKTQQAVVALSGHKSHHMQLREMYESGELTAMKYRFRRVGFNREFQGALLDAAATFEQAAQAAPGSQWRAFDSDSSDFSD
ncbi:hypothetical protein B0H21DRAFT_706536 [Amylocystis lapponica]|nr:hypothetical protein B0H21DRAFT_706536 [Amylocystis lapponica]